jgi:fructokinase
MNQKTILSFGEVLWDLLPEGNVLGGAPCNFAFRMHSFGNRSIMVSRLGTDTNGKKARDVLTKLGLTLEGVQSDSEFPTGTVQVTLDQQHNPDYFIVPDVAYDQITVTPYLEGLVKNVDALCFGTLAQRSFKSQETLHWLLDHLPPDTIKVYDINLRKNCYDKQTIEKSLWQADILKLSDEETSKIANMFGFDHENLTKMGKHLVDQWNLKCCLITLGSKGALAFERNGENIYQPGFKIEMKEPVGAGDACTAGFTHHFLNGDPLKTCCQTGCGLGALVATQSGATEIVSAQSLKSFLNSCLNLEIDARFKHMIQP